jgi:TetR/AcrR family transcriptional repressor of nem operon
MKPSLREDILNAGLKVMFRSGYHAATCAISAKPLALRKALYQSLPLKAFAQEVLDRYFANLGRLSERLWRTSPLAPAAVETLSGHHQRRTGGAKWIAVA